MPFYEYRCSTCGKTFEVLQSMSDDPLTACTGQTCVRDDGKRRGRGKIARVLHAPAIHFKGSGFHNTDYGSNRRGGADGDSGSGSDKKPDTSSSPSKDSGSSKTVGLDKV